MNIGKAIKNLRQSSGLSQQELSKKAGITQAGLSQLENGSKRFNDETINKISEALGVPASLIYITGLEKSDVPDQKKELYDQLFPVIKSLVSQLGNTTK